ncbi:hypothetical protein SEVIR_4G070200v4 [Setaria viridis]|uniref:Uncharacterized protein n=1 Tax=Setaria viridis TaxID=4556 RepID=A0A4U6UU94_SETVI|nr:uncharacterized protein LOC117853250 [Setaria viridis]TKW20201.1 hypothetical protein SEVIR_4G070200v2 [Setaria viridis]
MRWRSNEELDFAGTGGDASPPVVHLTALRCPEDMASRLSCCLQSMSTVPRRRQGPAPTSQQGDCEYIRCLRLCLVEALARLPTATARRHIRGLMLAGHCYGLLDPVSNIILNSIWYDITFPPPPAAAAAAEGEILDNRCLLRVERRSLDGLVALVCAAALLSEHEAIEYLCYASCDLSDNDVLQTAMLEALLSSSTQGNLLFATAAEAAKHPQPLALGKFLASLAPEQLDRLRSLLKPRTTTVLSGASIEEIYELLRGWHPSSPASSLVPELSPEASRTLASKKEAFNELLRFIRGVLDELLHRYAASHPKEPRYDLGVVCGLAVADRCSLGAPCYHVNFLAASAIPDDHHHHGDRRQTLFFAEFGRLGTRLDYSIRDRRMDESKPAFCRPVALSAHHLGRCSLCEGRSSRILHPATGSYHTNAGKDVNGATIPFRYWNNTFGPGLAVSVGGEQLQSEFVYFDQRDARIAELLNEVGSREERALDTPSRMITPQDDWRFSSDRAS